MMNRFIELAEQAGATHKPRLGVYQFFKSELEDFIRLVLKEYETKPQIVFKWTRPHGFAQLEPLLRLVSTKYNTETRKCCYTISEGNLELTIPVKETEWRSFTIEEKDYNLLADTLFIEIVRFLNSEE